jgi:hypothetical protein
MASDATLAEEFNHLVSVRELSDGRVLLSDNRDNRIVVADFRTNGVTAVGRVGSGPSEFRRAGPLIPLNEDSTLLADYSNGRWLLLSGSQIVRTLPADDRTVLLAPMPSGADRGGRVLAQRFSIRIGGHVDSTFLFLVSRTSGRVDTIAMLRTLSMRLQPPVKSASSRITVQRISVSSWSAGDQAILFPDGWVAIARLSPYGVEWHEPSGRRLEAPPLPFTPTPLDEHEKRAYMERIARATGRAPESPETRSDWPEEIPPFSSVSSILGQPAPALLASPDGRLLIQRMLSAAMPEQRYDVVARDGRLVGQLVLGPDERMLGFGVKHVYVVVSDENGIERLRRHPWP